jgi:mRNA-degrading endonuclease HigB of HigAB toxin-antitoxin module
MENFPYLSLFSLASEYACWICSSDNRPAMYCSICLQDRLDCRNRWSVVSDRYRVTAVTLKYQKCRIRQVQSDSRYTEISQVSYQTGTEWQPLHWNITSVVSDRYRVTAVTLKYHKCHIRQVQSDSRYTEISKVSYQTGTEWQLLHWNITSVVSDRYRVTAVILKYQKCRIRQVQSDSRYTEISQV